MINGPAAKSSPCRRVHSGHNPVFSGRRHGSPSRLGAVPAAAKRSNYPPDAIAGRVGDHFTPNLWTVNCSYVSPGLQHGGGEVRPVRRIGIMLGLRDRSRNACR